MPYAVCLSQRMDRVETGVTAQLEKTLERLAAINNQQQEQQRTVEAIQGEQYSMNARLQALESKVHVLQTTGTSSAADTDFGGRKPALIVGGWGDDTPAEETLNNVKQIWTSPPTRPLCQVPCPEGVRYTSLRRQGGGGPAATPRTTFGGA